MVTAEMCSTPSSMPMKKAASGTSSSRMPVVPPRDQPLALAAAVLDLADETARGEFGHDLAGGRPVQPETAGELRPAHAAGGAEALQRGHHVDEADAPGRRARGDGVTHGRPPRGEGRALDAPQRTWSAQANHPRRNRQRPEAETRGWSACADQAGLYNFLTAEPSDAGRRHDTRTWTGGDCERPVPTIRFPLRCDKPWRTPLPPSGPWRTRARRPRPVRRPSRTRVGGPAALGLVHLQFDVLLGMFRKGIVIGPGVAPDGTRQRQALVHHRRREALEHDVAL